LGRAWCGEGSGRHGFQRLRKNSILGGFERARLPVAPQKPNKINSGFSRRIEYSTCERLFPQPLSALPPNAHKDTGFSR
jgi:hypothetical protein